MRRLWSDLGPIKSKTALWSKMTQCMDIRLIGRWCRTLVVVSVGCGARWRGLVSLVVRVGLLGRALVSLRDFHHLLYPPLLSLSTLPDVFIIQMYILQLEFFTILYLNCAGNSSIKMELGDQPKPRSRTAKNIGDEKVTSANVVIERPR